jgi:glycosyltransferase involved in cell wall biosynthesis
MTEAKKKIIFAAHSLCPGGQERVVGVLINEFSKQNNVEIHLVLFGKYPELFYSIPGQTIIHKPEFKFNDNQRFWYTLKTMLFIRQTLNQIKADAILSFGEHWNSLVLLSCIGCNFPIFVSDRNQPGKNLGLIQEKLRTYLYPKAKGIIAQTATAKEILFSKTKHTNIAIIGNPIPEVILNETIKRENIVLSVGRLIDTKHHDVLIKSFVKVRKGDWKLIIVGDDAIKQRNKEKLELLVKSLNAQNYIEIPGKSNEVQKYYQRAKVFAFTSSSEGFPNVIGEAMMAGLPVVAFDCVAGPAEMINDNSNGFLVPLFNFEEFENKLSLLINSELTINKMSVNALNSIQQFNAQSISKKFFDFVMNHNI